MKKIWYAPNKFEAYGEEEIQAVTDCLRDGWLAGFGPKTVLFEQKISNYFGKKYGLMVNSGSSANLLAILSLNLEPGSEIITPACTFATTVAPIIQSGMIPVFCDVILNQFVPSVDQVLEKITEKTRVIMIPNLIGSKPDWIGLKEAVNKNIILIEDSCDTMTTTPETDISTTSFYASHIITACGSGGMVMFNDISHLKRATMYRDWGRIGDNSERSEDRFNENIDGISYDWKFLYGVIGYNFKSSEVNAAFGLIQFNKLSEIKTIRKTLFKRYLGNLKNNQDIILPIDNDNDWLAIPLIFKKDRIALLKYLEENNVQTRVCFSGNITRHPAFRQYLEEFKVSDYLMDKAFLLGCHHGMSIKDVDHVCLLINNF